MHCTVTELPCSSDEVSVMEMEQSQRGQVKGGNNYNSGVVVVT